MAQVRQTLSENDHHLWKKVICELHYQYNELVIWVIMFKRKDVFDCYEKTLTIYKEYADGLGDLDINAYFYAKMDDGRYISFAFDSLEEFLTGTTIDGPLDANIYDEVSYSLMKLITPLI